MAARSAAHSDSSWTQLTPPPSGDSDLSDLQSAPSELDSEWELTSGPPSPRLEVPPTDFDQWRILRLQPGQGNDDTRSSKEGKEVDEAPLTDRDVALRLYAELEGRPWQETPASPSTYSVDSDETFTAPARRERHWSVTPPPEPVAELREDLKHFQQSEGARLAGFLQCDAAARQSLLLFLLCEGHSQAQAIMIADEIDGAEHENGLTRDQHGQWYRIKDERDPVDVAIRLRREQHFSSAPKTMAQLCPAPSPTRPLASTVTGPLAAPDAKEVIDFPQRRDQVFRPASVKEEEAPPMYSPSRIWDSSLADDDAFDIACE